MCSQCFSYESFFFWFLSMTKIQMLTPFLTVLLSHCGFRLLGPVESGGLVCCVLCCGGCLSFLIPSIHASPDPWNPCFSQNLTMGRFEMSMSASKILVLISLGRAWAWVFFKSPQEMLMEMHGPEELFWSLCPEVISSREPALRCASLQS